MTIGGRPYDKAQFKSIGAYVMQSDVLFEQLTVREVMDFAARCRMPAGTTADQRTLRINYCWPCLR